MDCPYCVSYAIFVGMHYGCAPGCLCHDCGMRMLEAQEASASTAHNRAHLANQRTAVAVLSSVLEKKETTIMSICSARHPVTNLRCMKEHDDQHHEVSWPGLGRLIWEEMHAEPVAVSAAEFQSLPAMKPMTDAEVALLRASLTAAAAEGIDARNEQQALQQAEEARQKRNHEEYVARCKLEARQWAAIDLPILVREAVKNKQTEIKLGEDEAGEARADVCTLLGLTVRRDTRRSFRVRSDGEYEDGDGGYTSHYYAYVPGTP